MREWGLALNAPVLGFDGIALGGFGFVVGAVDRGLAEAGVGLASVDVVGLGFGVAGLDFAGAFGLGLDFGFDLRFEDVMEVVSASSISIISLDCSSSSSSVYFLAFFVVLRFPLTLPLTLNPLSSSLTSSSFTSSPNLVRFRPRGGS